MKTICCAAALVLLSGVAKAADEIYVKMQEGAPAILSNGGEFTMENGDCYPFIGYDGTQTLMELKFGPFTFWTRTDYGQIVPEAGSAEAAAKYRADVAKFRAMTPEQPPVAAIPDMPAMPGRGRLPAMPPLGAETAEIMRELAEIRQELRQLERNGGQPAPGPRTFISRPGAATMPRNWLPEHVPSPAPPAPASTGTYDARADFSSTRNPNGPWTYGWSNELAGPLHVYPTAFESASSENWGDDAIESLGAPHVAYNPHDVTIDRIPGHAMNIHPGPQNQFSHCLWTAPKAGVYEIQTSFKALCTGGPHAYILKNGVSLADSLLTEEGIPWVCTFDSVRLAAGDTIDAAVGVGQNGTFFNDETQFSLTITPEAGGAAPQKRPMAGPWQVSPSSEATVADAPNGCNSRTIQMSVRPRAALVPPAPSAATAASPAKPAVLPADDYGSASSH